MTTPTAILTTTTVGSTTTEAAIALGGLDLSTALATVSGTQQSIASWLGANPTVSVATLTTSYPRSIADYAGEEVHVVSFVPTGTALSAVTDWGPIWNAALAECRAIVASGRQFRLIGPGCNQTVSTTINMTDLGYGTSTTPFGSQVDFNNGRIVGATAGAAVIDAMNTWFLRISNLTISGAIKKSNGTVDDPTVTGDSPTAVGQVPTIGFQHGRAVTNSNADTLQFDNCFFNGYYSLAAYYNLASESLSFLSGYISNGCPAAYATGVVSVGNNTAGIAPTPVSGAAKTCYAAILDGLNHWQVPTLSQLPKQSGNVAFPPETLVSFEESTFLNVTFSNTGGPALWMSHCASPRFIRCYANSGAGQSLIDIYRIQGDNFNNVDFDFHFECFGSSSTVFTVASAVASGASTITLTASPSPPYFGTVSVSGTGIPTGCTATFNGAALTLSAATTTAISSGASITLSGGTPNLYIFRLLGPANQFQFHGGFSFRDSGTYAATSVFKLAGSNSPTVNIQDIDIKLEVVVNGSTNTTTATLFDTPASYTTVGDITCQAVVYNGVNHTGRLNLDGAISEVGKVVFNGVLSNASANAAMADLGLNIVQDSVQSITLTAAGGYYSTSGTSSGYTPGVTLPAPAAGGTQATASVSQMSLTSHNIGLTPGSGYTASLNGATLAVKDTNGVTLPWTVAVYTNSSGVVTDVYPQGNATNIAPGPYTFTGGGSGTGCTFGAVFNLTAIQVVNGGSGYQANTGPLVPSFSTANQQALPSGTVQMMATLGSFNVAAGQKIGLDVAGTNWIEEDTNGKIVIGSGTTRLMSINPATNPPTYTVTAAWTVGTP